MWRPTEVATDSGRLRRHSGPIRTAQHHTVWRGKMRLSDLERVALRRQLIGHNLVGGGHRPVADYVRRYECTGTLDHHDGEPPVACECIATQEHDGTVTLECVSPPDSPVPSHWMKAFFGEPLEATLFKGSLKNGLPIEAEGTLLGRPGGWNRDRGTAATFGLTGNSRLTVGRPDDAAEWRFAITNLLFAVPAGRPPRPGAASESLLLALPAGTVTIAQLPDYDDIKRELRGRHAVQVTSEACVPRSLPLDEARNLVSDLCSVLSLAEGTLVNWIFCEQRDADGKQLFAVHHPAITRPYNGALPLIDPRRPAEMPAFVESVFGPFRDIEDSYRLGATVRALVDVRTTGFLETRCLQLLSVMEFVIGRNAVLNGREFVMADVAFKAKRESLTRTFSEVLRLAFGSLAKQAADEMAEHVQGLNYTSFRRRLRKAAASFGVRLEKSDVNGVAETRNELVHRASFVTDEPMKEFQRVQSVLDKLLLGLLGYRGPYIDAKTFERATKPLGTNAPQP